MANTPLPPSDAKLIDPTGYMYIINPLCSDRQWGAQNRQNS
jgi:hypothetical protein